MNILTSFEEKGHCSLLQRRKKQGALSSVLQEGQRWTAHRVWDQGIRFANSGDTGQNVGSAPVPLKAKP